MEKKYKRIPFDLELAKAITKGEKEGRVVTRDGYPIEYLDFEHEENEFPVIAIIRINGNTRCEVYAEDGFVISKENEQDCDLFLEVPDEQEFKEGDLVFQSQELCSWLSLLKSSVEKGEEIFTYDYVSLYLTGGNKGVIEYDTYSNAADEIRLATPEENQLLIDALKKDNSERARECLKLFFGIEVERKFTLNQEVLVRDIMSEWRHAHYSHFSKRYDLHVADAMPWQKCIPYNEQTKHLLGTTDDWEG